MPYPLARFVRHISSALLLGCAAAASAQPAAQPAPSKPPIEHFFGKAQFSRPVLSPDGRHLAIITGAKGQRAGLHVIDLATNKITTVAHYKDFDVAAVDWVNGARLVFSVSDHTQAQGQIDVGPGLYAVNVDGSGMQQLVRRHWDDLIGSSLSRAEPLGPNSNLAYAGLQDSDAVFVTQRIYRDGELVELELNRLDTKTGRYERVPGPKGTRSWMFDHRGEPRIAISLKEQIQTIHWQQPGTKTWTPLTSFDVYKEGPGAFEPLAIGADGKLYILAKKGDKKAVHTFDVASARVSDDALIETTGYDFNGQLLMRAGILEGFRYTTDALNTYWIDPGMRALQAEVDAKLPGTINTLSRPRRPETPWILVRAFSDALPTTTMLYNTATKTFKPVGSSHPEILHEQMGRQEAITYTARDGLPIPALLTLPKGQRKNLPLVVLVHGGPYVDGASWGWDAESQFLASRGYAVLEPSFRGTTGLGDAHYRAGWKQWGLAMQDDIADGARWAIKQGYADATRICIAGASYGGYSTLMGLIRDPELFKCGVNWVGVTDIPLMQKTHWLLENDTPDVYRKYGFPELLGDVVKDAERFRATSPLVQAAKITQPLLMAYGGADLRVPLNHGTEFYQAVKRTNNNVEWVVYPDEGHGFFLEKNRIDFYQRMENFLAKHIGKAAAAP